MGSSAEMQKCDYRTILWEFFGTAETPFDEVYSLFTVAVPTIWGELSDSQLSRALIECLFLFQWLQLQTVFSCTFTDMFLVLISIGLITILQSFNDRIERACKNHLVSAHFWTELRKHYVLICDLFEFINARISNLILLSFCRNLYFIIVEIFNGFKYEILTAFIWKCFLKFVEITGHSIPMISINTFISSMY